jgi:hypothetical protein
MKRENELHMADQSAALPRGGLRVIGAGFGRTGTLSLKAALEELGFGPCYHMIEVFRHPEDIAHWQAAARGAPIDWNELFEGYQSTVDWPGCAFYEELMQAYPDARVLLTVRDPERWYDSANETIYHIYRSFTRSPLAIVFSLVAGVFVPSRKRVSQMINAIIWEGTFGGNFEDRQLAIAIFNQHIEAVKQRVPPDRLLVYNVKEGWQPLCAFLGVEVPVDKPFPHLNERSSFVGNRTWLRNRGRMFAILFGASGLAVFLILFLRRQLK